MSVGWIQLGGEKSGLASVLGALHQAGHREAPSDDATSLLFWALQSFSLVAGEANLAAH